MNSTVRVVGRVYGSILVLLLLLASASEAHRSSITYRKAWAAGVSAHVVTINLSDPGVRVAPVLPKYGVGRSDSWGAMLARTKPTAAITGTFFGTRSMYPTGDIVVEGATECHGRVGTAICIGWDNSVRFIPLRRGQHKEWSGYRSVMVGGPLLVWSGKISVNPREQGFKDPRLYARKARTAVGATKSGDLLMVVVKTPVYLRKLARVMRGLGVWQAAALDGGGSTALYYRGKSLASPSRRLTNLLVAYDESSVYASMMGALAPGGYQYARRYGSGPR
jgi:hypothetical protein